MVKRILILLNTAQLASDCLDHDHVLSHSAIRVRKAPEIDKWPSQHHEIAFDNVRIVRRVMDVLLFFIKE